MHGGAAGMHGEAGSGTVESPPPAEFPLLLGAVALFDSTCPAGFTELTDMRNRYVRGHDGDTDRAEAGGAATHSHDIAGHSHTALESGSAHTHGIGTNNPPHASGDTDTQNFSAAHRDHGHPGSMSDADGGAHEHGTIEALPLTTDEAEYLPAFREVVFCRLELPEAKVPVGGMVLASSKCGEGFTEVEDARNRFLRGHDGNDAYGELGGNDAHTHAFPHDHDGTTDLGGEHTHGGTTTGPSDSGTQLWGGADNPIALQNHTHSISLTADSHQHAFSGPSVTAGSEVVPSYHEVAVCKAGASSLLPKGALVLFDDVSCPDGFTERTQFQNRFLRGHDGDDDFGERSGSDTHDHVTSHDHGGMSESVAHNHGGTHKTGTASAARNGRISGGTPATQSTGNHTHSGVVTMSGEHAHPISSESPSSTESTSLPEYRELIVCERE